MNPEDSIYVQAHHIKDDKWMWMCSNFVYLDMMLSRSYHFYLRDDYSPSDNTILKPGKLYNKETNTIDFNRYQNSLMEFDELCVRDCPMGFRLQTYKHNPMKFKLGVKEWLLIK
jgi:hypothetical protein